MELSEVDNELVCLVAVGLTDDEIATQLKTSKRKVLEHMARLLALLGAQDRLEIILYAYSDPAIMERISAEASNKASEKLKAKTPEGKPKRKQKAG